MGLIIEAVFEDMTSKKEVFARLDSAANPNATLATNTSYFDANAIAAATADPSRVIGLHPFAPAHIMKLIEIVVPGKIADDTLATGLALARTLGKIPVLSGICDGFIVNHIMSANRREADYMIEGGAMPWDVDAAMVAFGFPMGIFAMGDLPRRNMSWAMRKRQAATRDPAQRYVDVGDRLCEMGQLGHKLRRVVPAAAAISATEIRWCRFARIDRTVRRRGTFAAGLGAAAQPACALAQAPL